MGINELSVKLSDYLPMIGAEVVTKQNEYGGEWTASLVEKHLGLENFEEDDSGKRRVKIIINNTTPEGAVNRLCNKFFEGKKIFLRENTLLFPFKRLIP